MNRRTTELDMTMLFAIHGALRRELEQLGRVAARGDGDPRIVLESALGWQLFTKFLRIHQMAEDAEVWPVVRSVAAANADQLELVAAMEAEHAQLQSLLTAIDTAVLDRAGDPGLLGDLLDALITELSGHFAHEEAEGVPLIEATLSPEQWRRFSEAHREQIGTDRARYLPWLLKDVDSARSEAILSRMPPELLTPYQDDWEPAFRSLSLWDGAVSSHRDA